MTKWIAAFFLCIFPGVSVLLGERFSVVVFNVENLFDADGVALYEDYRPPEEGGNYTPRHLATKLTNIVETLRLFDRGRGPDIVLFQEIEADRTPNLWHGDLVRFLTDHTGTSVQELLGDGWDGSLRGVPAYAWLFKAVADALPREYFMAVGEYRREGEPVPAIVNVTLSRFPITEQRTHQSPQARGTLETKLDVSGHPLRVFNAHWKSGASNAEMEVIRLENARVVRERLDEIFREDPHADVILGGDFNSQYNQRARFPDMRRTALNDVLGSQGDVLALRRENGPDLYNLWFELPPERRGSDIFRGNWGTLMQIILSRGLYDYRGVQYVPGSFRAAAVPGMNADPVTGLPVRWTFAGEAGAGFSDHFPIFAWFKVVEDDAPKRWVSLDNPSRDADGPTEPVPIDFAGARLDLAPSANEIADRQPLQGPDWVGRALRVEAVVSGEQPFRVKVGEEEFHIWSFDGELRQRIYSEYAPGDRIEFVGELGRHRGNWQFVIQHESWLKTKQPAAARR